MNRRDFLKLSGAGALGFVGASLFKPKPPKRKKKMNVNFDSAGSGNYQAASAGYGFEFVPTASVIEAAGVIANVAIFTSGASATSIDYKNRDLQFIRADTNGIYRSELWYMPLRYQVDGDEIANISFSTTVASIMSIYIYGYFGGIGAHGGTTGTGTPTSLAITTLQNNSLVFSGLASEMTGLVIASGDGQADRGGFSGPLGWGWASEKGPVSPPASTTLTFVGMDPTDAWAQSSVELLSYQDNPPAIMGM